VELVVNTGASRADTQPPIVSVGVDVGQRHDPTAVVVAEAVYPDPTPGAPDEPTYAVRAITRLPLGTLYPAVVAFIEEAITTLRRRGVTSPTLFVDATGVGPAVVDPLRLRLRASGSAARLVGVYFTHGDRFTENRPDHTATLGKAFLVSRLQSLLQSGRITLPRTPESEALAEELLNYEIHVDERANDTYGAFRVGSHDDLVTALGLATLPSSDGQFMRDMMRRAAMQRQRALEAEMVMTPFRTRP